MQQTRARSGLEFLLPQKVWELEAQSNIVGKKQIISYTKSSYLPVLAGIAEISHESRHIYDERRNTAVMQALKFHSNSYSSVLQQSITSTQNSFTFADFGSPKMLRDSEMPVLNSLTGALNLAAVKVKSYSEDSLPTPTAEERTFVLGPPTSSCLGSGSHCHHHQPAAGCSHRKLEFSKLQSMSFSNPEAIVSTSVTGGLQVPQVFPDPVATFAAQLSASGYTSHVRLVDDCSVDSK